jgi:hypothetical protein
MMNLSTKNMQAGQFRRNLNRNVVRCRTSLRDVHVSRTVDGSSHFDSCSRGWSLPNCEVVVKRDSHSGTDCWNGGSYRTGLLQSTSRRDELDAIFLHGARATWLGDFTTSRRLSLAWLPACLPACLPCLPPDGMFG